MTNADLADDNLKRRARQMARDGMTIKAISEELGITWNEASDYTLGWLGAKTRITRRLNRLASEENPAQRAEIANDVDRYVDFLYDAAKHLRSQVNSARKALNR